MTNPLFRVLTPALILSAALGSSAQAAFVGTFDGNDCSGVFGTPPDCVVPAQDGIPNDTPLIAKLLPDGTVDEFGLFSSIDGSEFTFDFGDDGTTGTGIWTYTPGPDDPLITAYVAKGGDRFNLFSNPDGLLTNTFFTPLNNGGNRAGLSHITFFDGGGGGINPPAEVVPTPATLLLIAAGVFGMGWARRKGARR